MSTYVKTAWNCEKRPRRKLKEILFYFDNLYTYLIYILEQHNFHENKYTLYTHLGWKQLAFMSSVSFNIEENLVSIPSLIALANGWQYFIAGFFSSRVLTDFKSWLIVGSKYPTQTFLSPCNIQGFCQIFKNFNIFLKNNHNH